MNEKLFEVPEEVKMTLLRQMCQMCNKPQEAEVPTKLWESYRDGFKDIQNIFDPNVWHWEDREVVLQSHRQHNGGIHYYLCPMCMCKIGLAEPHELRTGMGPAS
tara:strand:+ start:330 stop:641 length:312 start_codon:yes stop_codon:yes gene_type:complete